MQKKPIIIFMMMILVFIGSQIAAAGMGDAHKAHMMGGGMMDESGDKGPDMMMHKMKMPMMGKGMGMPMMYPWDYLKDRLNLTEEQAEKFGKLYSEYRKEVLRKSVDIEIATMDLTDLIKNRSSSDKAIEESANKLGSLRSALHSYRIRTLLKTKEFLSDDQYGDLVNFISGWMGHHRRGMPWVHDNEWDDDM
ncbi:MAG: hypothetical protein A2Z60_04165 [Nitrospirae bacterium RIFCSPLOWO2_02_42_7]|nr:MAG: hypothetical protein A2Z60_04165 [Nitrospirae bacterium RIFCSPLOWO2_02_42_7]HAS16882.1 hypothetical protein [Nitrospiraceae bacterium]